MADSTSRWAEALREMSGRLEEMPGDEGYPAYLSARLAEFYERAGIVKVLGSADQVGSVTAIGAVSPPGGDLSEPVAQATLRIVKVFWGLSAALAYRRHFPAIDWLISYSLYADRLDPWYDKHVSGEFKSLRAFMMAVLGDEARLDEIVRLVGMDALSDRDRITMETAKMIREDYLHQNSFHEVDTYTGLQKQYRMLRLIKRYHDLCMVAVSEYADLTKLLSIPSKERIGRAKYLLESQMDSFDDIDKQMMAEINAIMGGEAHV